MSDLRPQPEREGELVDGLTARLAGALGYAGACFIPLLLFVAWLDPGFESLARRLSAIYAAVILSFLGGIQWGLALRSPLAEIRARRLVAGVLPSLWAVAALTMPIVACDVFLLVGFVALLIYEHVERRDDVYPAWYLPLRLRLTAFICAGLAVTLLA